MITMRMSQVLQRLPSTCHPASYTLVFAVIVMMCGGCKLPREAERLSRATNPGAAAELRDEAVVQDFEDRRNRAHYEAAIARWEQGGAAECEGMLRTLIKRQPDFVDARLALADLLAADSRYEAAEVELYRVMKQQPHNAQAFHSLGLLKETTGEHEEAEVLLGRAAELQPSNELYVATAQQYETNPSNPAELTRLANLPHRSSYQPSSCSSGTCQPHSLPVPRVANLSTPNHTIYPRSMAPSNTQPMRQPIDGRGWKDPVIRYVETPSYRQHPLIERQINQRSILPQNCSIT